LTLVIIAWCNSEQHFFVDFGKFEFIIIKCHIVMFFKVHVVVNCHVATTCTPWGFQALLFLFFVQAHIAGSPALFGLILCFGKMSWISSSSTGSLGHLGERVDEEGLDIVGPCHIEALLLGFYVKPLYSHSTY
jgi:hypothetical protein